MKLQLALRISLLSTTAGGFVAAATTDTKQEDARRRRNILKEQAVSTVERFLLLFQSHNDDGHERQKLNEDAWSHQKAEASTRVLWDGKYLTPIENEHEKDSFDRKLIAERGRLSTTGYRKHGISSRRRRRRRAKGNKNSKGGKSCKSAKNGDELQVITKTIKGSKSNPDEEEILCFQGTAEDVTKACEMYNADCCTDPYGGAYSPPCSWPYDKPSTICQGACNGYKSCYEIPAGSVIGPSSCSGYSACEYAAGQSNDCEPLEIGSESCQGYNACSRVCSSSEQCKVAIGDNSCTPNEGFGSGSACRSLVGYSSSAQEVSIGDDACKGDYACYEIASFNGVSMKIGDGACISKYACERIEGEDVDIGAQSCRGEYSCRTIGSSNSKNVEIGTQSCTASSSCTSVGLDGQDVTIGKGSCKTRDSCGFLGLRTSGGVEVGDESCTSAYSCFNLGSEVLDKDIFVGKRACSTADFQCNGSRYDICLAAYYIPKDATSCSG